MNDYKTNLESLLLGYYIKYDRLFMLCNRSLANINSDVIDIYIDLYDILKPIYTKEVYANKKYVIVSSIINLAAHLRGYFWTRHRLHTRIFLVYGEAITLQHKQFYPTFGDEKFKETNNYERNKNFINSQLELVKILCAYIYDVYYIHKNSDFSMFVYDNIVNNQKIPAIILSKSKYAYQIPALLNNSVIFRPKKYSGEDISFVVSRASVNQTFYNKISNTTVLDRLSRINPSLLSLMISLTGLPSYNLKTLLNITTASKLVDDAISFNRIINDYNNDINYVYNSLIGLDKYIDPVSFSYRFNAVDIVTQHRIYNSTAEARDISWYINLNDPNTIKDINNKYFIDNPLDLNNL